MNNVVKWIQENKLQINETKCNKITFSRCSNVYNFSYSIRGTTINTVDKIRDLGILLDSNWSFEEHLRIVVAKSFRTLGFIKRTTSHFSSPEVIIYLFKALVLPNLNYCSVIWSPYSKKDFDTLNSVLKRFLRYMAFKMGKPMKFTEHNYSEISSKCKLYNMESTHKLNDLNFMLDNLKHRIDTPHFNNLFKKRNLIYDLRDQRPFQESILTRNYIHHAPVHRIARTWNALSSEDRDILLNMETKDKIKLKSDILKHFSD